MGYNGVQADDPGLALAFGFFALLASASPGGGPRERGGVSRRRRVGLDGLEGLGGARHRHRALRLVAHHHRLCKVKGRGLIEVAHSEMKKERQQGDIKDIKESDMNIFLTAE